jgi:tRNA (cytidine/uridine-2'-O-)-methyltransferase
MTPLHVILWQPEIPPNTGNIARLCAANRTPLHLIGRLGFRLDDRHLRRAGLDYWEHVEVHRHDTFADFETWWSAHGLDLARLFCLSAHADQAYTAIAFRPGDGLVFGSESGGLPPEVMERYRDRTLVIPMSSNAVRSLNLATAVGIVLYEGFRQLRGGSQTR